MKLFEICLTLPDHLEPEAEDSAEYDDDLDDIRSVIRDVCLALDQVGGVSFRVTVESPISVSVRRDLCVVMEQILDVMVAINERDESSIDLYEQGVEERLIFKADIDGGILVERRPLVASDSVVAIRLHIERTTLLGTLSKLAERFLIGARARCPIRTEHHLFVSWADKLASEVERIANDRN